MKAKSGNIEHVRETIAFAFSVPLRVCGQFRGDLALTFSGPLRLGGEPFALAVN